MESEDQFGGNPSSNFNALNTTAVPVTQNVFQTEKEALRNQIMFNNQKSNMITPPKGLFSTLGSGFQQQDGPSQSFSGFSRSVSESFQSAGIDAFNQKGIFTSVGGTTNLLSSERFPSSVFQSSTTNQGSIFAAAKQNENQFSFTKPSTPKISSENLSAQRSIEASIPSAFHKRDDLSNPQLSAVPSPKNLFSTTSLESNAPGTNAAPAVSTTEFPNLFKDNTSSSSQVFITAGSTEGSRKRLFNLTGGQEEEGGKEPPFIAAKQSLSRRPSNRLVRKEKPESTGLFQGPSSIVKKALRMDSALTESPGSSMVRRRRLSSSSAPQVDTVAIQCTKVPREQNDKDSLRHHFSRYGQVVRVRPNQLRHSATIHFSNSNEAALAKEKGKNYFGQPIHIYLYKPRTASADKSLLQQKDSNSGRAKIVPKAKSPQKRSFGVVATKSRSLQAKSNADKLALLDKIDKILRAQTVKQSDLSKAVVAVGTCPDMCPEKERYLRLQRNLLSLYEMGPNRTMNHSIVVKEYSRSSADQEEALPNELRPSSVLRITLDYLLTHVLRTIDYERTAEWYDFVWNRTRAIRKEVSIQQLNDPLAIEVTEECARFHICCAHELCEMDLTNFDPKINDENLEKTMKTVLDMYEDLHRRQAVYQPPNEAEFQSYFILLNINRSSDVLRAVKNMKESVRCSGEVRLAVSAFSAIHSNNYSRFFTVVDQASYLQAALLHRYFKQVRQQAIRIMARAYTSKPQCFIPVGDVIRSLRFNNVIELESFCASYEITVKKERVILLRAVEYTADSLSSFCSIEIARKMIGQTLGDVIANGRQPSTEIPQPTSSFDEDGYYIGPHADLLSTPASSSASPSKKILPVTTAPSDTAASVTDIYVTLQQKGISNDIVKNLAKDLFIDIIEETILDISQKELLAAQHYVVSERVSVDILHGDVLKELRKIVYDTILFEKMEVERRLQEAEEAERRRVEELLRREAEKRKRLELERKMQELQECIDRSSLKVSDDLEKDVVSELVLEISQSTYKEEQFKHTTEMTSNQIMNDTVSTILRDIVTDCMKCERKSLHLTLNTKLKTKLTAIRWAKWRKQLEKLRLHRLSCQLFPCTSLSRDIHQQISELLSNERSRKSLTGEDSDSLTREPFSKLYEGHNQLRDDVIKRIPVIESIYYDMLPFNTIVFDNAKHPLNEDTIFWKVSLTTPGRNKSSNWLSWLQHKFGFRSKTSNDFKDTFVEESSHGRIDTTPLHSCVCCKMLSEDDRMKSEVFGTSSLILLITDDDVSDFSRFKKFLDRLFSYTRPVPPIPLLVLSCDAPNSNEEMLSDLLLTYSILSTFRIIEFNTYDFVTNCNKLSSGVEWLAAESPMTSPGLRCCRLGDFLEEQLSRHYIAPMYRDLGLRAEQELSSVEPYLIVELYNKILDDICQCVTNDGLLEVSWPAPEFCQLSSASSASFPGENWNSREVFSKLKNLFQELKLPNLPELHSCDEIKEVEERLTKYCHEVCPKQHHLALPICRAIESFAGANHIVDGVNLFSLLPWQRLIDAIASSVFEIVVYTELGNTVVVFTEESLENIKLPAKFVGDASRIEFQDLEDSDKITFHANLDQTFHSVSLGAENNLKKILETSSNLENFPIAHNWLESDNVFERSTNQASVLKEEIRNELEDSRRFEQDLENIIASGEDFLGRFSP